jgi:membrane protease YdiL (CAAX protease family)
MDEADIARRRYNALMIVGIVLPFLIYPFLSLIFLSKTQTYVYEFTCSRFLIWITVGLMYLYATKTEMQRFILWDEERYDFLTYLKFMGVLIALYFAAVFISVIPRLLGMHEDNHVATKVAGLIKQYPLLLVFTCLTAGFTEEFIFRGYMISRLSLFFKNPHVPVIISAVLFAAVHLAYKTLHELIFALLVGLIFGYHYQKYRNLGVLIVMHFLIDFTALTAYNLHK